MTYQCSNCHTEFEPTRHRRMRWATAGLGAIIGGTMTESFLGGAVIGALSYGAATAYDEYRARRCPTCGQVYTGPSEVEVEEPTAPREAERPPVTAH